MQHEPDHFCLPACLLACYPYWEMAHCASLQACKVPGWPGGRVAGVPRLVSVGVALQAGCQVLACCCCCCRCICFLGAGEKDAITRCLQLQKTSGET